MNRRFYEDRAAAFVDKRQRPWGGWRRLPIPRPRPGESRARILDVGCGHGRFLRHWIDAELPPVDYLGVDFSPALLERARGLSGRALDQVRWRQARVPEMPLADPSEPPGSFDLVVAFGLLHHVVGASRREALVRAMAEATAPGGRVVFTVWRFGRGDRYAARARPAPPEIAAVEPTAVVLDFDGAGERLCVDIPGAEVDRWPAAAALCEEARFEADGRGDVVNLYLVARRPPAAGSSIPSAAS